MISGGLLSGEETGKCSVRRYYIKLAFPLAVSGRDVNLVASIAFPLIFSLLVMNAFSPSNFPSDDVLLLRLQCTPFDFSRPSSVLGGIVRRLVINELSFSSRPYLHCANNGLHTTARWGIRCPRSPALTIDHTEPELDRLVFFPRPTTHSELSYWRNEQCLSICLGPELLYAS